MLYINMELSGVKFQAFVDTGAQSTIISKFFAQKCGVLKDVDTRFRGVAVGVGTSTILGRIHSAKLKVDNRHTIECSLQVIENLGMDFLLGIDMLRKHRVGGTHKCHIDLSSNILRFPHERVDVPFIKDHEIIRGKNELLAEGGSMGSLGNILPRGPEPGAQEKEKRIKTLQCMGASRAQSETLLKRCAWNVDLAGSVYFEENQR